MFIHHKSVQFLDLKFFSSCGISFEILYFNTFDSIHFFLFADKQDFRVPFISLYFHKNFKFCTNTLFKNCKQKENPSEKKRGNEFVFLLYNGKQKPHFEYREL